ncbi:MAG: Polysaccharide deacetylase [candidate division WS6 bacterium GW2011_GWF2_39_15]|uniref:Polysaccharide deacetylase n=1 Tax=candidate division WS6 bacterium GW2011_GWF2_39_15 TaxID=1619100 RepID=A0A0G0MNT8_9BACT|nr:MAG: Polysaccharide deacetylase [candidate division WS6 bacterium GW2011_GWF2_39_15]
MIKKITAKVLIILLFTIIVVSLTYLGALLFQKVQEARYEQIPQITEYSQHQAELIDFAGQIDTPSNKESLSTTSYPLTGFPSNYDDTLKKLNISLTYTQKVNLLANGVTITTSNPGVALQESYSSYYSDLMQKDLPILMTRESLANLFNYSMTEIKQRIIESSLNPLLHETAKDLSRYFRKASTTSQSRYIQQQSIIMKMQMDNTSALLSNKKYEDALIQLNDFFDINTKTKLYIFYALASTDHIEDIARLNRINNIFDISPQALNFDKEFKYTKDLEGEVIEKTLKNFKISADNEPQNTIHSWQLMQSDIYPVYSLSNSVEKVLEQQSLEIINQSRFTFDNEPSEKSVPATSNEAYLEVAPELYTLYTKVCSVVKNELESSGMLDQTTNESLDELSETFSYLADSSTINPNPEHVARILSMSNNLGAPEENTRVVIKLRLTAVKDQQGKVILATSPVSIIEKRDAESNTWSVLSQYDITPPNNNFNEKYDFKIKPQAKGTVRVPILMYHQIAAVPTSGSQFVKGLYVSPKEFETQLAYLVAHNYKALTPQELHDILATGENPKQKSIMITFDDGVRNHYTTAYPLLKKYGLTGVFFVVSHRSSIKGNELKEMANNGMSIDSHSATHANLKTTDDPVKLAFEITSSKYGLQSLTGRLVNGIAYPGCVADTESFGVVAGSGYKIGVSCGNSIDHTFYRRLSLARIHAFGDMASFKKALSWGL